MLRKALILIVEDNDVDFHIAEIMLKKVLEKVTIYRCRNGEEAFSYLHNLKTSFPNFILLDIDMPIMNGKEFLKAKSQNESFKQIPVVVLSSSVWNEEKEECIKLGAEAFIEKPITVDSVVNTLKSYTYANL